LKIFRFIGLIFFCLPFISIAQKADFVVLRKIYLHGNHRTKDRIVLREMDVKEGDTLLLAKLDTLLNNNRNRIYNTRLFNEVNLLLLPDSANYKSLLVELIERWYIFPIPIFELADRSFNEWWYNQSHELNRLNYGVRFSDKNFRGRKEELRLIVQGGFTKKLGLGYTVPYLNKKQTLGMDMDMMYDQNKQISFVTKDNKQQFLKTDDLLRERLRMGINFFYRRSFFATHTFGLRYNRTRVADTIGRLNTDYFRFGDSKQNYFQFSYEFTFDKRDVRAYAQKGYFINFSYEQRGFTPLDDVNIAVLEASFSKYQPLGRNFFFASLSKGKAFFPNKIPYYNTRAMGYDQDYVRGYDLYVIDAQMFALQRLTFRKKLFEKEVMVRSFLPMRQFNKVPFAAYLNAYYDIGYGYSSTIFPGNQYLSNEWLRGGGIGIDVVTYYDSVIRLEYSINKMLERRIYLAFTTDI
jgi:outer membrane protein assembly factor BamA